MTMKHKKNWEAYCETAFNSMKANIHNWETLTLNAH